MYILIQYPLNKTPHLKKQRVKYHFSVLIQNCEVLRVRGLLNIIILWFILLHYMVQSVTEQP